MIKRIGMLTSGGDCQALNATMRGVVKGLSNNLDVIILPPIKLSRINAIQWSMLVIYFWN